MNSTPKRKLLIKNCFIVIIFNIFFISIVLQQPRILTVKAISSSFTENFSTTTYMDVVNTTADGWGLGNISCKYKVPIYAGSYDTPDYATDVFVAGDYAYVTDFFGGLQVINISDPITPTYTGSYNILGAAISVFIDDTYAYVAASSGGLQVFNISDPTTPTYAGSYDTLDYARGVFISGDYAYVAVSVDGLQVFNISDPTTPTYAGSYDTPLGYANDIFIAGDYTYVADGYNGLLVINISDPTTPTYAGSYNTTGFANGVFVTGDCAYVTVDNSFNRTGFGGLQVINISDPTTPTYAGSYATDSTESDVFVAGNYAYVARGFDLQVINISNPTNPTYKCSYPPTPRVQGCVFNGVFIAGDHAYLASGFCGLEVIVSNKDKYHQFNSPCIAQSSIVFYSSYNITNATLISTATVPVNTSINYYLSANGGMNWEQVTPGVNHTFTNNGNRLKWKIELNASALHTPRLFELIIHYTCGSSTTKNSAYFPSLFGVLIFLSVVTIFIRRAEEH